MKFQVFDHESTSSIFFLLKGLSKDKIFKRLLEKIFKEEIAPTIPLLSTVLFCIVCRSHDPKLM